MNTHTDVIAPGQAGKTSLIIWRGREHILSDHQIVRLAWKKDLYESDVSFAALFRDFKVVLLNPSGGSGYNPFKLSGEVSTHSENLAKTVVENVSEDKLKSVQSYAEAAEPYFAYLALKGLHPSDTQRMFDDPKQWLLHSLDIPEPYKSTFQRIGRSKGREFLDHVGTLRRRLRPFINSTALRNFTSSGKSVSEYLDEGYSIFLNGAPSDLLSVESAKIINGLFLSDLMRWGIHHATRYAENRTPIYCYVDEIQEFAPPDFASGIDTVLGAGLRFTLIHHHADQLPERLRASVETNARIKILGGGLSIEVRKQYAEVAYSRQINKDMHRQPQISYVTEYEEEGVESEMHGEFGDSITLSTRLHPHAEEIQTGWDDYSREQKVSFYAERFEVPDHTFTEIFPNGKTKQFTVPDLRRYLNNSPEVLEFVRTHEPSPERKVVVITPKTPLARPRR